MGLCLAHTHKSKIPKEILSYCIDLFFFFFRFFIGKCGSRTLKGRSLIYKQAQSYTAHSQTLLRFRAAQK